MPRYRFLSDRNAREIAVFFAAVALGVAAFAILRPDPRPGVRLTPIDLPPGAGLHPAESLFDVSDDGSTLVYRASRPDGESELRWRRLGLGSDAAPGERDSSVTAIPGTEGAGLPAISPDGNDVAFTSGDQPARVRSVSLDGGSARTLVTDAIPRGVAWSPDGLWIYYTNTARGLSRVSTAGGASEVLTVAESIVGESLHWAVDVLPGGRALVYTESLLGEDDPRIRVLDLVTGEERDLWSGSFARYSTTGHLVFSSIDEAGLSAVAFDIDRLDLVGRPERAVAGVVRQGPWPLFAVSRSGVLVYARPSGSVTVSPAWVERDGGFTPVDPGWSFPGHRTWSSVALSPADDRLIVSRPFDDGSWHLWLRSLRTDGAPVRLTHDGEVNYRPTWSSDGQSMTYISDREGQADLWRQRIDDPTSAGRILDRPGVVRNGFVSPDARWIVFREGEAPVADIFAARSDGVSGTIPMAASSAGERSPALSPDGRWLAYTAFEEGAWQVWVTSFDTTSERWRVSSDGGEEPVWAHSGAELFFRDAANQLVSVAIAPGANFAPGPPRVLFSTLAFLGSDGRAQYDISSDDHRFLMLRIVEGADLELVRADHLLAGLSRGGGE